MKYLLTLFLSLFCFQSNATLKIAVIDTGFNLKYKNKVKFCKEGHKDFSEEGINDTHGHGTNIIGLIADGNENNDYCVVVIKYIGKKNKFNTNFQFIQALSYAYRLKPNIIHLSLGGENAMRFEQRLVKQILQSNIQIVSAAGNESQNLDIKCNFFPACYDKRIWMIGNKNKLSNYGKAVDLVINGNNKTKFGVKLSGTSQSAAIFTGNIIKQYNKKLRRPQSQEQQAKKYVLKAIYKQTNMDDKVDRLVQNFLPEELKEYGAWAGIMIKATAEQKITYKWTF